MDLRQDALDAHAGSAFDLGTSGGRYSIGPSVVIVQSQPPDLLLIAQPDHAGLAADLMTAWVDGPSKRPRADDLLLAIREHDNGWREPDALPQVDPDGRPYDFIQGPVPVRQGVWPRGVGRLSHRPYAAALVAQHALTIYEGNRANLTWQPFFAALGAERDRLLKDAGASGDSARQAFHEDYAFLRLGDLLSLTFCNGWKDAADYGGFRATLEGTTLSITPDPFGGAAVPLKVRSRRIPDRRYASDGDLQDTLAAAPDSWLIGQALGI